jgi:hypothetical protein
MSRIGSEIIGDVYSCIKHPKAQSIYIEIAENPMEILAKQLYPNFYTFKMGNSYKCYRFNIDYKFDLWDDIEIALKKVRSYIIQQIRPIISNYHPQKVENDTVQIIGITTNAINFYQYSHNDVEIEETIKDYMTELLQDSTDFDELLSLITDEIAAEHLYKRYFITEYGKSKTEILYGYDKTMSYIDIKIGVNQCLYAIIYDFLKNILLFAINNNVDGYDFESWPILINKTSQKILVAPQLQPLIKELQSLLPHTIKLDVNKYQLTELRPININVQKLLDQVFDDSFELVEN